MVSDHAFGFRRGALRRALIHVALLGCVSCARKPEPNDALAGEAVVPGAVSAAAATATATTTAPTASPSVVVLADRCRQICANSTTLQCKNATECMPNCLDMGSLRACLAEVSTLYGCLSNQPSEHWECAEDGVAAIRVGFCEAEQARAVSCMEKNLKP